MALVVISKQILEKEGAVVKKLILIAGLVALVLGILLVILAFLGMLELEPQEIGIEADGGEVILHAPGYILSGQLLILTLETNPTTGYSWQLGEFDEAVLKLELYKYVPREHVAGQMGVGGEAIWYFQAQSPGTTILHLEYTRSWEEDVEPAKTFTVRVVVRPAGLPLR